MATSRSEPPLSAPPDVIAAIVAAVEVAWPRPIAASAPPADSPWRFSNRWWMPRRSPAADRHRP